MDLRKILPLGSPRGGPGKRAEAVQLDSRTVFYLYKYI